MSTRSVVRPAVAGAIVAAFMMLGLSLLAWLGIYEGPARMMERWPERHMQGNGMESHFGSDQMGHAGHGGMPR